MARAAILYFLLVAICSSLGDRISYEWRKTPDGAPHIVLSVDESEAPSSEKRYLEENSGLKLSHKMDVREDVLVSMDRHYQNPVTAVTCDTDLLVIRFTDNEHFAKLLVPGKYIVGGLDWGCKNSDGDYVPFYREIVHVIKTEHEGGETIVTAETEDSTPYAPFNYLEMDFHMPEIHSGHKRGLFDSIKNAVNKVKDTVTGVVDRVVDAVSDGIAALTKGISYDSGTKSLLKVDKSYASLINKIVFGPLSLTCSDADCRIQTNVDGYFSIRVAITGLKYFKAGVKVRLVQSLIPTLQFLSQTHKPITLWTLPSTPITVMAGPVPIVLRADVTVSLDLSATAAVLSFRTGYTFTYDYESYWEYDGSNWKKTGPGSSKSISLVSPEFKVRLTDVEIEIGFPVRVGLAIYEIIMPYFELTPYGKVDLAKCDTGLNPTLYSGLNFAIGLKVGMIKILGKQIYGGFNVLRLDFPITGDIKMPCPVCGKCIPLPAALQKRGNDKQITPPKVTYLWQSGEWTKCTAKCGGGNQNRPVNCIKGGEKGEKVDVSFCLGLQKPISERACNGHACHRCPFFSHHGCDKCVLAGCNWCDSKRACQEVTAPASSCPENYYNKNNTCRHRFELAKSHDSETINVLTLDSDGRYCIPFVGTENVPYRIATDNINDKESSDIWTGHGLPKAVFWTPAFPKFCFKPHGFKTGTYIFVIMQEDYNDNMIFYFANVSAAHNQKAYHHRFGDWEDCSKACGKGGVATRQADCLDWNGAIVPHEKCGFLPALKKPCNKHACKADSDLVFDKPGKKPSVTPGTTWTINWSGGRPDSIIRIAYRKVKAFDGHIRASDRGRVDVYQVQRVTEWKYGADRRSVVIHEGPNWSKNDKGKAVQEFTWTVPAISPSKRYVLEIYELDDHLNLLKQHPNHRQVFELSSPTVWNITYTVDDDSSPDCRINLTSTEGGHFPVTLAGPFKKGEQKLITRVVKSVGVSIDWAKADSSCKLGTLVLVTPEGTHAYSFRAKDKAEGSINCLPLACKACGESNNCGWCGSRSLCLPLTRQNTSTPLIVCNGGYLPHGCPTTQDICSPKTGPKLDLAAAGVTGTVTETSPTTNPTTINTQPTTQPTTSTPSTHTTNLKIETAPSTTSSSWTGLLIAVVVLSSVVLALLMVLVVVFLLKKSQPSDF